MKFITEADFRAYAKAQGYSLAVGEWVDGERAVVARLPESPEIEPGFWAASIGGECPPIQDVRDNRAALNDPRG